jgi:AcrR family transcriptional regulator
LKQSSASVAISDPVGHHDAMTTTGPAAPRTARERFRRQMTAEIKDVARRHLADSGAAALSLRAVARDVGLVSSAVYRYFPSRDDLLTALIVDAYDAVGEAAERAEEATAGAPVGERWAALAAAVRDWATGRPHEYALVYGSPVPGYRAPTETVDPASRPALVLLRLLRDGVASGEIADGETGRLSRGLRHDLAVLRAGAAPGVPDAVLARGLLVWTQLFGQITFELFGHLHNVIDDTDALFALQVRATTDLLVGGAA